MAEREREPEWDWQAATGAPGEIHTFEGRMRATGQAASNLRNADPRLRRHQWRMARTGLVFVGVALALLAAVIVVDVLF